MIAILLYGLLVLCGGYALFLAWIARHWHAGKRAECIVAPDELVPLVSIIVPARNEAATIQACLHALTAQRYPAERTEIIVVDDHSTDGTARLARQIHPRRIRVLTARGTGKKAALRTGIESARGELIVTTDADVTVEPDWLGTLAAKYAAGASMILAPVRIDGPDDFLTAWQHLDVCGTMLLTGAAVHAGHPLLANGANLAFDRAAFVAWGGYAGNEHRASGDDVFLLQKAVRHPSYSIAFVYARRATAVTDAEPTGRRLLRQRLRWAGKTGGYRDPYLIIFQALVFTLNAGLPATLPLWFWRPDALPWLLLPWLGKLIPEHLYLRYAGREIGDSARLKYLPLVQLTHPFYLTAVGGATLLRVRVRWKGRKVD